jgi:transposase
VSIHKSAHLQELCEYSGIILKFLPLYLPDFNPIKATFKDLKAWIRKNYMLVPEFKSFNSFLIFAISQAYKVHAKAHFRKAGYIVD